MNANEHGGSLTEMSLEELWELFPISLVEPNGTWAQQYRKIEAELIETLGDVSGLCVNHIGSTAIAGIKAKDIVDVLVEVDAVEPLPAVAESLEALGFVRMSETSTRISMNLGYTLEGYAEEVFHIHLRYRGDNDELYFRDYLNEHPDVAREYEALKVSLCIRYDHDRDAYTDAKADFVRTWSEAARDAYEGRYQAFREEGEGVCSCLGSFDIVRAREMKSAI